jgi:anti-anti-sigma factor
VSDRTVVTVTGDIDMISAPLLASNLHRHLAAHPAELVIDLTAVPYLGAAAMAVLADIATRGAQSGTTVTVAALPGSMAHRVITLTDLGDFLHLRPAASGPRDPRLPPPRNCQDMHNTGVDEQTARMGACGQLHLPTGRTCTREHGHPGSCHFVPRDHVEEAIASQRRGSRF